MTGRKPHCKPKHRLSDVAHLLTERQREVLALRRTPRLLVQLARYAPRGACCVCWRDTNGGREGEEKLRACDRKLEGTHIRPCLNLLRALKDMRAEQQQRAKQPLVAALEACAP